VGAEGAAGASRMVLGAQVMLEVMMRCITPGPLLAGACGESLGAIETGFEAGRMFEGLLALVFFCLHGFISFFINCSLLVLFEPIEEFVELYILLFSSFTGYILRSANVLGRAVG